MALTGKFAQVFSQTENLWSHLIFCSATGTTVLMIHLWQCSACKYMSHCRLHVLNLAWDGTYRIKKNKWMIFFFSMTPKICQIIKCAAVTATWGGPTSFRQSASYSWAVQAGSASPWTASPRPHLEVPWCDTQTRLILQPSLLRLLPPWWSSTLFVLQRLIKRRRKQHK